MNESPYDPVLLNAAQAGDTTALNELLKIVQPDIRRYAYQNCKISDVNDAVQETLWLIYRRVNALRQINSFAAWTFSIVRRECWRLGKLVRFKSADLEEISPDESLLFMPLDDLRRDLAKAIESLPEHYRKIIILRDIQEFTIDEIATHLEQTRESVKAKLHRARLLLREYLKD